MNAPLVMRRRRTPLRALATRYANGEITREDYLAERRRLLNRIERELRASATPGRAGRSCQPAVTPGQGSRWVVLLIAGVILISLLLLLR
jgi:hypothetical protein